jgi:hypothetical protein
VIEQRPLADGGWQWTARSVDTRGVIGEHTITERFNAEGERIAAARSALPPGVSLIDLSKTLPADPAIPTITNKKSMKTATDCAARIDRSMKGAKVGELSGKAHEDSGRHLLNKKKSDGSTFDHGHEMRVSRDSLLNNVIGPLDALLVHKFEGPKLTPEERAYITSVRDRAQAAVDLINYALTGGPMPTPIADGVLAYNARITGEQKAAGEKMTARLDVTETLAFTKPFKAAPLDAPAKLARALDVPLIAKDQASLAMVRSTEPGPKGYTEDQYRLFAEEVATAKLLSDLGGPKFLGVLEAKDGRLAIVTERVTTFEGTPVTAELMGQLRPQLEALRTAGYDVESYRLVKTADGRVVIDRASVVKLSGGAAPHDYGADVMQLHLSAEGESLRAPDWREQVWNESQGKIGWAKDLPTAQLEAAKGLIASAPESVQLSFAKSASGKLVFIESQVGHDGTRRWRQRSIGLDGSLGEATFMAVTREGKPADTPPFGVLRDDGMHVKGFGADGFEHNFEVRRGTQLGPPVDPATFPVLNEAQVAQMKTQFTEHVNRTSYNDVAPTLEFMAFYRDAKKQNPSLTMLQAFSMFNLDGGALVNKYNGGNCFSLAENFGGILKAQGIESYMVGQQGINAALLLPDREPRYAGLGYIDRAHGSLLVPYKTPQGEIRYLHFETGVGHNDPPKHTTLAALSKGLYEKPDRPILNPSEILRNRMRMLNELVISDMNRSPRPTLKVNMIDGTLTLRHVDGLALKPGETQAKIDFVKLMESGDSTRLIELLTVAQKEFNQPPNFVRDMLTLMESRVTGEYKALMYEDAHPYYDEVDVERHGGGT